MSLPLYMISVSLICSHLELIGEPPIDDPVTDSTILPIAHIGAPFIVENNSIEIQHDETSLNDTILTIEPPPIPTTPPELTTYIDFSSYFFNVFYFLYDFMSYIVWNQREWFS